MMDDVGTVLMFAMVVLLGVLAGMFVLDAVWRVKQSVRRYRLRRVEAAAGVLWTFTAPRLYVVGDGLRLSGRARGVLVDADGRLGRRVAIHQDMWVPVTRGIAAAAEVDGVREVSVFTTDGEIDSVSVTFSCGMRMAVQHFPELHVATVER